MQIPQETRYLLHQMQWTKSRQVSLTSTSWGFRYNKKARAQRKRNQEENHCAVVLPQLGNRPHHDCWARELSNLQSWCPRKTSMRGWDWTGSWRIADHGSRKGVGDVEAKKGRDKSIHVHVENILSR